MSPNNSLDMVTNLLIIYMVFGATSKFYDVGCAA